MKETQILGSLLPSHPNFRILMQKIREKYNLPEISPNDVEISEIYLGDQLVSIGEFLNDVENELRANLWFIPPEFLSPYLSVSAFSKTQHDAKFQKIIDSWPEEEAEAKAIAKYTLNFTNQIGEFFKSIVDPKIEAIADMLCYYMLTGEADEIPNEWISQVATAEMFNQKIVCAMAGPMADIDVVVQQFREEYINTFGGYHPRVTKTHVSTAYYLGLQFADKPWKFIVEEFIRLNKFSLPRDKSSARYTQTRNRYAQTLKKKMQRTKTIFLAMMRDKK